MATLLLAALPYVGGGVLGAAATYGLTWIRERRRSLDTHRAPQRQAIGDIVAATHLLMLRELESRTAQTEMVQHIRRDAPPAGQLVGQFMATTAALGKATLDAERAFQIGRLTIVDAPCWEAMGVAYVTLDNLRGAMVDAPAMHSPEEIEHYVAGIAVVAELFNRNVAALVIAATDRVSPTETLWNRRRRRAARRRLGERFGSAPEALQRADEPQQS